MNNKKYVSEIIGNEYNEWEYGSIVTIQAQTGAGKSYFIQNNLYDSLQQGEKILFLVNRRDLKYQFRCDMCKKLNIEATDILNRANYGNLTIMTYQTLQEQIRTEKYGGEKVNLAQYRYIVCDEIHYLLSDSTFNNKTREIYDYLINTKFFITTRIFISATMDNVDVILKAILKDVTRYSYTSPVDYSYITGIPFKTTNDIAMRIKNSPKDEKWLVFVNNKNQAKLIMDVVTNKECRFIYSTREEEILDLRNEIATNNRFECDVLITTKVLENGVNLFMEDLKNIVIFEWDKTTFIQELGRLRPIEGQEVNLYIPCKGLRNFREILTQNKWKDRDKMLEEYQLALEDEYAMNKFKMKYWDSDHKNLDDQVFFVENDIININHIGLSKYVIDKNFINYMCEKYYKIDTELHKFIFPLEVAKWLGINATNFITDLIENEIDMTTSSELEQFLDNAYNNDEKFTKEYFRETVDNIISNDENLSIIMNKLDGGNGRAKGMKIYNKLFNELGLDYLVGSKTRQETIDKKRKKITEWVIVKDN